MLKRRGRNTTLYNYKTNKPKETQRGHKRDTVSTVMFQRPETVEKIIDLIKNNPKITTTELAEILEITMKGC